MLKIKDAQLKYGLSDSQIENITEQFNRYDLDKDGRIGETAIPFLHYYRAGPDLRQCRLK